MKTSYLARRIEALHDDSGVAIILVTAIGMIVCALLLTLTAYTILSTKHSRMEQDTQAALGAAQAGVDEYLSRLNADNTYWQGVHCDNTAMLKAGYGTCGWPGPRVGWVAISGATTTGAGAAAAAPVNCATTAVGGEFAASCAVYHYDVDSSQTVATGTIGLSSTGKAHGKTRTVKVVIRRQSFGDFLYFTDYETIDPENSFVYGVPTNARTAACTAHFWDTPARPANPTCADITFGNGDTINGAVHSNDAILAANVTFNGPVTTSFPPCQANSTGVAPPAASCYRSGGPGTAFTRGISYLTPLTMPPVNTDLKNQTDAAQTPTPGCAYVGPTRIQFLAGGSMMVWSPYTQTVNPGCGTAPFGASAQTVTPPQNNVIYVGDVPPSQSLPAAGTCANGSIGGFPQANDINAASGDYDCRKGLLFVEGTFNGRMTVGASTIFIVNDIKYDTSSAGNDSLGLVAGGSVKIYHPVRCTAFNGSGLCTAGTNLRKPDNNFFNNPTVDAAMLSLNHSFEVQAHSLGSPLGTLTVFGSIAQKFRGAVATTGGGGSGYIKSYSYDTRLKFAPPPYYLDPVQAKYVSAVFSEQHPDYGPNQ